MPASSRTEKWLRSANKLLPPCPCRVRLKAILVRLSLPPTRFSCRFPERITDGRFCILFAPICADSFCLITTEQALGGSSAEVLGETRQVLHAAKVAGRSEEHTSELQSLMRISYAVFCLKKKLQIHDII